VRDSVCKQPAGSTEYSVLKQFFLRKKNCARNTLYCLLNAFNPEAVPRYNNFVKKITKPLQKETHNVILLFFNIIKGARIWTSQLQAGT
jgi:hypothetical protein